MLWSIFLLLEVRGGICLAVGAGLSLGLAVGVVDLCGLVACGLLDRGGRVVPSDLFTAVVVAHFQCFVTFV